MFAGTHAESMRNLHIIIWKYPWKTSCVHEPNENYVIYSFIYCAACMGMIWPFTAKKAQQKKLQWPNFIRYIESIPLEHIMHLNLYSPLFTCYHQKFYSLRIVCSVAAVVVVCSSCASGHLAFIYSEYWHLSAHIFIQFKFHFVSFAIHLVLVSVSDLVSTD